MLPLGEKLDVVLFGATGTTGGNALPYLAERVAELGLRWGVAGRRPQTLMQRVADLPLEQQPEVLEADLDEPVTLQEIAASARVVINAVGPYRRSAAPVIAACISAGAHYIDVTGETDVVAEMLRRFDEDARAAGVRIVQAAGYEALPFDLAVLLATERAAARGTRVVAADAIGSFALPPGLPRPSDGISGGTYASTVEAVRGGEMATLLDPASLLDDPAEAGRVRTSSPLGLLPRLAGRSVVVPMVPSPLTNPPVVHRTAAVLRREGGGPTPDFRYREGLSLGDGLLTLPLQLALAAPIGAATAGATWLARLAPQPLREAAATAMERLGPDAGAGPRPDRLEGWRWRLDVVAECADGSTERVVVDADGHPGYLATSRMLAEAALLLADDGADLPERTGHLTPALALGTNELERFARAGVRIRAAMSAPDAVLALDDTAMRAAGVSRQKTRYLRELAQRLVDGRVELTTITARDDADAMAHLQAVPGIGPWTASVFLLFALRRRDLFPVGDRALQVGTAEVLHLDDVPTGDDLAAIAQRWAPRRSAAAVLIWHAYLARRGRTM